MSHLGSAESVEGDGGLKEVAREVGVELDEEAVAAQLGENLQQLRPEDRQVPHRHLPRRRFPACHRFCYQCTGRQNELFLEVAHVLFWKLSLSSKTIMIQDKQM